MLAQLPNAAGYSAISFPVDFAGAITLVLQLKLRFPRTKVMVGVWGFSGNTERALQRLQQRSLSVW